MWKVKSGNWMSVLGFRSLAIPPSQETETCCSFSLLFAVLFAIAVLSANGEEAISEEDSRQWSDAVSPHLYPPFQESIPGWANCMRKA